MAQGEQASTAPSVPPGEIPLAGAAAPVPVGWSYALPPLPPGAGFNPLLHPDRGRETLLALGRLRLATATAAFASALSTAVGVLALNLLLTPGMAGSIIDLPPALGLLLVAWLTELVAVALGWSAFQDLSDASIGISREHMEACRRAVHLVYLAAAAWLIGGLSGAFVTGTYYLGGMGNLTSGEVPRAAVESFTVSFALTGIAVNVLLAFAMQTVLARLLTERGRKLKALFYRLAIGGTLAAVAVSIVCVVALDTVDVHGIVAAVSVASLAVYWGQVREAERGTQAMAATRGFDPDALVPA